MTELKNAKEQLLDSAESLIQTRGYNDFSFRDLAESVGISSASVHHHYRTKEALGVAVTSRYTERFITLLEEQSAKSDDAKKLLNIYIKLFRKSLVEEGHMCLCGMLGAEIDSLPNLVAKETKIFFEKNLVWLTSVFKLNKAKASFKAETKAKILLSTLEGALILSRTNKDNKLFDEITNKLADRLLSQ